MKQIMLLILTIMISASMWAQGVVQRGKMDNGKYRFIFVYNINNRSGDHIYQIAKRYVRGTYLQSSSTVKYGQPEFDQEKNLVKVPVRIKYESSNCLETLYLFGTLSFAGKENKCKLELSDLTYGNYVDGHITKITNVRGATFAGEGSIEDLLYKCNICTQDIDYLSTILFDNYRYTVKSFHAYLKDYVKSSVQDF